MGRALPQRPQLRSPGGLATPQAGFTRRFGGPSGSAASLCKRYPQSMQATAPSRRDEPQAGHLVGGAVIAGEDGGGAVVPRAPSPSSGPESGRTPGVAAAAAVDASAGTPNGL